TAADPYIGRDKIVELEPDVVTLDIEMPRMDGITFLKILMKHKPLPVVIMSSLSQKGSRYALEALEAGAVDVLAKPGTAYSVGEVAGDLVRKVKAAYLARHRICKRPFLQSSDSSDKSEEKKTTTRIQPLSSSGVAVSQPTSVGGTRVPQPAPMGAQRERPYKPPKVPTLPPVPFDPGTVILLGASTGGTEALKDVLTQLPGKIPPICIVQHIPAYFSAAFAERLNSLSEMEVREARDGDALRPGLALVAPGDYHMILAKSPSGLGYVVRLKQGPKVWHQRPAVDLLFKSAAPLLGRKAVAGLLTGMGQDGAQGLLELRQAGARTFAQDEATCVVFGMPHAAQNLGAAEKMVPLPEIPRHILSLISISNAT
ncbi:MAG: chemotaxis response regulator protein-glutamate methylesterase, partial [Chthoniobacterales bacterium]|nr:chemotaxis response regulator protein-glutamate methylesterase [Chthoniobacterales bacterium]